MFKIIRVMTSIMWGIIGLALWIPLLARTVMAFNLIMFFTIVTQDGRAITQAHKNVKLATTFYIAGFYNILDWTNEEEITRVPNLYELNHEIGSFTLFLLEILWTGIWWSLFLYSIS